jgi:sulfate/thiosulfate transport system substrate-binding protein
VPPNKPGWRLARGWIRRLDLIAVAAVVLAAVTITVKNAPVDRGNELVNVSYDPTRELYQELNPLFLTSYEKETGQHWTVVQSHGGSSSQAKKVIGGEQPADVVTLGLYSDVDALRKRGLIASGWADRLPNHSVPYTSTIVFVVRQGNPHHIADWPDLLAPGLEVITPDPRTSGNGKLAALAAWAAITTRGGGDGEAGAYLHALYRHVPVLDEGARGAAVTFAVQETGGVHLTWENEALREVAEANGKLQVVCPPVSILAEPAVAWVDATVSRKDDREAAKAYLTFLFSDPGQETIARLGYRPWKTEAAQRVGAAFPEITLVPISALGRDWDAANDKFFADDGIVSAIVESRAK